MMYKGILYALGEEWGLFGGADVIVNGCWLCYFAIDIKSFFLRVVNVFFEIQWRHCDDIYSSNKFRLVL